MNFKRRNINTISCLTSTILSLKRLKLRKIIKIDSNGQISFVNPDLGFLFDHGISMASISIIQAFNLLTINKSLSFQEKIFPIEALILLALFNIIKEEASEIPSWQISTWISCFNTSYEHKKETVEWKHLKELSLSRLIFKSTNDKYNITNSGVIWLQSRGIINTYDFGNSLVRKFRTHNEGVINLIYENLESFDHNPEDDVTSFLIRISIVIWTTQLNHMKKTSLASILYFLNASPREVNPNIVLAFELLFKHKTIKSANYYIWPKFNYSSGLSYPKFTKDFLLIKKNILKGKKLKKLKKKAIFKEIKAEVILMDANFASELLSSFNNDKCPASQDDILWFSSFKEAQPSQVQKKTDTFLQPVHELMGLEGRPGEETLPSNPTQNDSFFSLDIPDS